MWFHLSFTWLAGWFVVSVDQSHLAMDGCYKVLEEYLYCQKVVNQNNDHPWAPAIEDILSVFMNFGKSDTASEPEPVPPTGFLSQSVAVFI